MTLQEEKDLANEFLNSTDKSKKLAGEADHRVWDYMEAISEINQLTPDNCSDEEFGNKMKEIRKNHSLPSDIYFPDHDLVFDEDDIFGVSLDVTDILNAYMDDDRELYYTYLKMHEEFDLDVFYILFGVQHKHCRYLTDIDLLVRMATNGKYTHLTEKSAEKAFLEIFQ